MRKFYVTALCLTSAIAVSMGSINVCAASGVSAPSVTESRGDSDGSFEDDSDGTSGYGLLLNYKDGLVTATYESPLDTPVKFTKYEVIFNDRVIISNGLDTSSGGNFSFKPTENGSYRVNVYYSIIEESGESSKVLSSFLSFSSKTTSTESTEVTETTKTVVSENKTGGSSATKSSSVSETSSAAAVEAGPSNLNGKVTVSYSVDNGTLKAVSDVKGSKEFVWYKDGKQFSKGQELIPKDEGSYYCVMTDTDNESDTSTSRTFTLYKVTSDDDITFSSPNGLYEAGSTVTATAKVSSDESVSKWKCSIKHLDVSVNGNSISFRMPNRSVKVSASCASEVKIRITDGKASKTKAKTGDVITIMADRKDGKTFSRWDISGAEDVADSSASVTKVTVGKKDITIKADYNSASTGYSSSSSSYSSSNSSYSEPSQNVSAPSSSHEADAKHAVYEVLDAGGYSVKVEHHSQGPLCDAAFKYSQAHDYLVTDYFNITVNDSLSTYEIPNSVKIRIVIPSDLRAQGRKWRMLCISKGGVPYSFDDEDTDDTTITFTTNRFYAYAMCYSDHVEEEPSPSYLTEPSSAPEVIDLDYEDPDVSYNEESYDYDFATSTIRPASESQIIGNQSGVMSSDYSNTLYNSSDEYDTEYLNNSDNANNDGGTSYGNTYGDTSSDVNTTYESGDASYDVSSDDNVKPVQSDKKPAIENGGNRKPAVFSL